MTNKNQDLYNWRNIHLYPYHERWIIEEEIRESKQKKIKKDWQEAIILSD